MEWSRDSYRKIVYPDQPLGAFRAYARFPQGLPKEIDRHSISLSGQREAVLAAEKDAYARHFKGLWILMGCCGSVFYGGGLIAAHVYDPDVPSDLVAARFMGKSPEYITFYIAAYETKAKSLQIKSAQNGCAALIGFLVGLYGGLLILSLD